MHKYQPLLDFINSHGVRALEAYGVYARQSTVNPNKYSLNYDQLEAKPPYDQYCRGTIVAWNEEIKKWEFMTLGFLRFFNHGEPRAANIDWSTARAQEKYDGTMILSYWDYQIQKWCFATRSVPDADLPCADGETYAQKASKHINYYDANINQTTIFELIGPNNPHIVSYQHNKLVLLTVIDLQTGNEIASYHVGLRCDETDIAWMHTENIPASEHEGYVIVDANFNRVKVKNQAYLLAHKATSRLVTPLHYLEIVLAEKVDDVLPVLALEKQEILNQLVSNLQNFNITMNSALQKLIALNQNRKTKALMIQEQDSNASIWMSYLLLDEPTDFLHWFKNRITTDKMKNELLRHCYPN